MTLDEAKDRLNACVRESLVDHAFSDAEIYWMDGETEVAVGYFGLDARGVTIGDARFVDDEASELLSCGRRGRVGAKRRAREPPLTLDDLTGPRTRRGGRRPRCAFSTATTPATWATSTWPTRTTDAHREDRRPSAPAVPAP